VRDEGGRDAGSLVGYPDLGVAFPLGCPYFNGRLGNGLDRLISVYPSREAAIAADLPVAQASTAGPPQVSHDLLDGIIRNLSMLA
jgi:hypothetical protein